MSIETTFLWRKDLPGGVLRELDDVRLLQPALTMDGDMIAAGTEGTVVAVWGKGEAYEIEFPEPMGALATVPANHVAFAGRPVA